MSRRDAWRVLASLMLVAIGLLGCQPRRVPLKREPPAAATDAFFFVQLTDTHWGALDGVALTRRAVEKINALPVVPAFVVITGDLFADTIGRTNVVDEALAAMRGLKVPLYYVPGNHDLRKEAYEATARLFTQRFGPLEQRVDVAGVACLFVNTEESAQRVREAIAQALPAGDAPALIFMHRPPLYDMQFGGVEGAAWDQAHDTRWDEFVVSHPGIKAFCCGHFHRDEMAWISEVPVYVASSMARFWERQPSFRLYRYHGGRLDYWTFYLERPRS